mmetsp:Transcript_19979/g.62131  ORF Transcript_19979/g.62131 Transcript_19979/m.62131 type:complete len:207 (+) Transcript_19979:1363-1983(+)
MLRAGEAARGHVGHVLGERPAADRADRRVPRGKLWLELVVEAEEVVHHLHLAARGHARADPDRRHAQLRCDERGELVRHHLKHDGEAARRLERARVREELARGDGRLTLHRVAAEGGVRLRRQSNMAHHRNARVDEGTHLREDAPPALQLHRVGAALLEQPRAVVHAVVGVEVGAKRKVGDEQRVRSAAARRLGVVDHLVHGDWRC